MLSFFKRQKPVHSLPGAGRIFAVGDVHGRLDLLLRLEEKIAAAAIPGSGVVFLGDYIDRGPDSAGVLEYLSRGRFAGLRTRYLLGNHEDMLLHSFDAPQLVQPWLAHGGMATLANYRVGLPAKLDPVARGEAIARQMRNALPAHHLAFLQSLELSLQVGDYLFVHAGIRPGRSLEQQTRQDLLTIREPFLGTRKVLPCRVVHGHSVTFEASVEPYRVGVDTGAYATGRLSCAVIEGSTVEIMSVDI